MKNFTWKNLILFALALLIVPPLAGQLGKFAGQRTNEAEATRAATPAANNKIRIVVSSQDAEGATQRDFDLEFLKNLEAYVVERTKVKAAEYLASQGIKETVELTSEATYVESGPVKLAVIRMRDRYGSTQIVLSGIVGAEFKRIGCIGEPGTTVPISYGPCADKIKEIFGVRIGE